MFCETCHVRDAVVHLTTTTPSEGTGEPTVQEQHFCRECADSYFSCTPGMNSQRDLICLSDWYRSKLHDLLEQTHPEVFEDVGQDFQRSWERNELMTGFLREHLKKDGVQVNDDAFGMLFSNLFCSHHFYSRRDQFKEKKSQFPEEGL